LPNFIASYLTAWYRKSKTSEKTFLLNKHVTTVQKYLIKRERDVDVLIGIQVFFYNEDVNENKCKSSLYIEYVGGIFLDEMMAFLLQFFLNHQCIDQHQIRKWYKVITVCRYEGLKQAKQLATPFVESLLANQTGRISS
jgi:hypothetical protein